MAKVYRVIVEVIANPLIHRRYAEKHRRLVLLERAKYHLRSRPLRHENGGGANRHRKRHGVAEAVGEEQFRSRKDEIILAHAEAALAGQARTAATTARHSAGTSRRSSLNIDGLKQIDV